MGQVESIIAASKSFIGTHNKAARIDQLDDVQEARDNEIIFKKIMNNFCLNKYNHKDPYLDTVDVYRCNHNIHFKIYLKEIITQSEVEMCEQIDMWLRRMHELKHPNLMQLHGCCHQKIESMCALFYKIFLIFDCVESDLHLHIKDSAFKEDELWEILDSAVGALAYLQERDLTHEAVRISTIYICPNTIGQKVIKIADSQLMGYESNYLKALTSKDLSISHSTGYLSPLLYHQLGMRVNQPSHDAFKSDVFSLGMILLQLCLFESSTDLYQHSDYSISTNILSEKLKRVSKLVSKDLSDIIKSMLEINEQAREDFISLDRRLSSLPILFQKRKAQIIEPSNLMQIPGFNRNEQSEKRIKQQDSNKENYDIKTGNFMEALSLKMKQSVTGVNQKLDALAIVSESLAKTSMLAQHLFSKEPLKSGDQEYSITNMLKSVGLVLDNDNNFPHNTEEKQQSLMLRQQGELLSQHPSTKIKNYEIPVTTHSPLKKQNPSNNQSFISMNKTLSNLNEQSRPYQQKEVQELKDNQLSQLQSDSNSFLMNLQISNTNQNQQNINDPYKRPKENPKGNEKSQINEREDCNYLFNNITPSKEMESQQQQQQLIQQPPQNLATIKQTIKYSNGNIYEGEILDGKKHGFGVFLFLSGQRYEGSWINNKRQGKGIQYFQDKKVKYEGNWEQDLYHGNGILFNKDPKSQGVYQYTLDETYKDLSFIGDMWISYDGDFKEGKKQGLGTITLLDHHQFCGEFNQGMAFGQGTFMFGDGSKLIVGEWSGDKLIKEY